MVTMANQDPLSRDVQLPGQDADSFDLDPTVVPEHEESSGDCDQSRANAASEAAEGQVPADSNPELGNTLIQPDNS